MVLVCLWGAQVMVRACTSDPAAIQVGADYLRYISWNMIGSGFIMTCSGVLQGLGNTWPALWSSATRLLTYVVPVTWLSTLPQFAIPQVWITSIVPVTLQAVLIGTLVVRRVNRLA